MLSSSKFLRALLLTTGIFASASTLPAFADESSGEVASADTASTADAGKNWFQKNGKASYLVWLQQMHTESLAGNRDGTGTNLDFDHFFALGARLNKQISLTATTYASQIIDEDDKSRQWQVGDLYLTLSHNKLFHSDAHAFNLDGYLRVYLPTSRNTRDALNKGTARDAGRGAIRILFNPAKSWLDGKLTLNGLFYSNIRFNSMTPTERYDRGTRQAALDGETKPTSTREDMYVVLDPSLVYSVSSKVDIYLEWCTGVLRHTTEGITNGKAVAGKWSSINHPSDGMYLSPGFYWNPTKKVSVNPYLSYQLSAVNDPSPTKRRVSLTHADVGLQLQYTFL